MTIETACAGLFLLAALLLALGARCAGEDGVQAGQIDPGIARLAGLIEAPDWDVLRAQWAALTMVDHGRFQAALLQILAGRRLFGGDTMFLYQVDLDGIGPALVAGADSGRLWLMGQAPSPTPVTATIQAWREEWQAATGVIPTIVTAEPLLAALARLPDVLPPTDSAYHEGQEALVAAWAALSPGRLDLPQADLTVSLTAVSLFRLWARWLRQFAGSSIAYLLANMIHRAGHLLVADDVMVVEMAARPLDMVLEMAGYLDELERVPWLEPPRVRFKRRGVS